MKRQFLIILGLVLLFGGGLIACSVLGLDPAPNVTIETLDETQSIESVTGESTKVVVEPTTTFVGEAQEQIEESEDITPTPENEASSDVPTDEVAEWRTFGDPFGIFTLPYPASAEFVPQPLENELFDYGYSFVGSEGNEAGMAVTFKVMPPAASEEAWLALANSPDLLMMLEQEFGLAGFVQQERQVAPGNQRSILLEGVFGEVQYSRMRFEEQDGIWVLMGIFYPIENPPTWEEEIKATVDRFSWFPEQFEEALVAKEEVAPPVTVTAEEEIVPPATGEEMQAFLFSDVLGVFHLSYPTSFTRVQMHGEGYGYTFATSDEKSRLEVRFDQLATPVSEEEWPTFAVNYLQSIGVDVTEATVTTKEGATGQRVIYLEIATEEGHQWARLAESNNMLALLLLTAPSDEWQTLSQSTTFQSWHEFVWYPEAAQAFFAAQLSLVPYDDPAGVFTLQHPPEFEHAYEGGNEQIGADYSATLSDAAELDMNSDVLELAVTLEREEDGPNETVLMLADPENPNWSWTGEPNSQRSYSYIDVGDMIIFSLSEASEGDLFTATWIVSLETWQIEKAALMASLQSIRWSAEAAR